MEGGGGSIEVQEHHGGTEDRDPRRWLALMVVLLTAFMDFLDASIIAVAIPSIQRDIGASYSAVQWVLAGYTLAFSLLMITGGRLGDLIGRKRMFLIGTAGFTVASALCGLAQSPEVLIASRVGQGMMAALTVPQVLAMIRVNFPEEERSKAYGLYGAFGGLAFVGGPLLGGILIEADLFGLDWRPIFLINVIVGPLAILGGLLWVRESKAAEETRIDPQGVVLVTTALLLLMFPLVQGRDLDWPLWTFLMMGASLPLFALFIGYERAKEARRESPLVSPRLFGQKSFSAGIAVTLIFSLAVGAFFLIYSITLQIGFGFSALHMALTMLPWPLAFIAGSGASTKLAPLLGRQLLVIGGLLLAASMAGQTYTFSLVDAAALHSWQLIPAMVLGGLGAGLVLPTITALVLADVKARDAGSASGLLNTTIQLGAAIGVAAVGVLFFNVVENHADSSASQVTPSLRTELEAAQLPPAGQDALVKDFEACFEARMSEKDPAAVPVECDPISSSELPPEAAPAVTQASSEAGSDNFKSAFQVALWLETALLLLSAALSLALPRREQLREAPVVSPA